MRGKVISTKDAPGAIGPYSQAVQANGFLFISGQVGLDPATGSLVSGGVVEQTERAITNLEAILAAAGCGLEDVVKTTVLLDTMDDFQTVNEVYGRRFGENRPARAAFAVQTLPLGSLVEIEAVAAMPQG